MSDTATQISEDIKTAMKARDAAALNPLRALKSALTNAAIEKGGLGTILEESEALAVVRKQIKGVSPHRSKGRSRKNRRG